MYIYKTTNLINGKIYIGQSKRNINETKLYIGSGKKMLSAIKHYGKKNFKKEVLFSFSQTNQNSKETLDSIERFFIHFFNSTNDEIGYNLLNGGHSNGKHSIETKIKMSNSKKGNKNWAFGKKKSKEYREKISKALTGRKRQYTLTNEMRKNISESKKGQKNGMFKQKPWNYGLTIAQQEEIKRILQFEKIKEEYPISWDYSY